MPKYYDFKVAGYYLYFTSFCVIECMHVHASDSKLTEGGSAKFFVKNNGDTVLQNRGILNDREIAKISEFIKDHYQEMYLRWSQYSEKGYYEKWWDTRTPGQILFHTTFGWFLKSVLCTYLLSVLCTDLCKCIIITRL